MSIIRNRIFIHCAIAALVASIASTMRAPAALAQKVATLGAITTQTWNQDVRAKLLSTRLFTQVDAIDVSMQASLRPPTLQQLLQYDAVLVYSDGSFYNNVALGDMLADYVNQGHGVVISTFAFFQSGGASLQGRIASGGYFPFTRGSQGQSPHLSLVALDPWHPVLEGVTSFDGGSSSFYNSGISISAGSTLVARWSNDVPLVGLREMPSGRVAGLNFYPPSSDIRPNFWMSSTSGARLMANALLWAANMLGPAATDISAENASGTFGGTVTLSATLTSKGSPLANKTISFTVNGNEAGSATTDDNGVATLSNVTLAPLSGRVRAGTYATGIAASFAGDSRLAASNTTASLTVNKADPSMRVDSEGTLTYDGLPHAAYAAVTGVFRERLEGATISYTEVSSGLTTSEPPITTGTYRVRASFEATADYSSISDDRTTIIINPRPLTVAADALTKVYGDVDPSLTYRLTAGSLVSSDIFSGILTRAGGENAGSYGIQQGSLSAGSNYALTFEPANLTIEKRPASVTPDNAGKTYGDADPQFTGNVAGFLAADQITASYVRTAGEGAGAYTIKAILGPAAALGNYEIAANTAPFTIGKAPLAIKAKNAAKLLGAPNPAFTAAFSGFVFGEGPQVLSGTMVYATPATISSPVGTYPVTPGGLTSPNYAITFSDGALTVGYNVCALYDESKPVRAGATIPLKLQLCSVAGANQSASAVIVSAESLTMISTDAAGEPEDPGNANPDQNFRFVGSAGYLYNLKTSGLLTGTYELSFMATSDPQTHVVRFKVK